MNLPRVTYSNTGEDFSGVHAHLDAIIPEAEARLLGKSRPAFIGGRDRSEGQVVDGSKSDRPRHHPRRISAGGRGARR